MNKATASKSTVAKTATPKTKATRKPKVATPEPVAETTPAPAETEAPAATEAAAQEAAQEAESQAPSFRQRLETLIQAQQSHMLVLKAQVQELRKLQREHDQLVKDASRKNKKKSFNVISLNPVEPLGLLNQSL